jgi:hypothetical protein
MTLRRYSSFPQLRCGAPGVLLIFAWLLVSAGCATISPLSVSEADLESYFREQVVKFDHEQLASGSPLSVGLNSVDITLGPEGREVIVLDIAGEVALHALVTRLPLAVSLTVEGAPVYLSNEQAIYIRRLNLVGSKIESPFFSGDFTPVTDNLMRVVAQLLEVVPVYRLDDSHWTGKLLTVAAMDLKVAPGKLVFVPAD